jgi:hypothetical protein
MYIHGARPDRRREEKFCRATGSGGIATVVCSGAKAFPGVAALMMMAAVIREPEWE